MILKAICFDLDETLLDDNTSYELSVQRVASDLAHAYPEFDFKDLLGAYRELSQAYWLEVADAVMGGAISGEDVRLESWRRALSHCGCDQPDLAREALDVYSRHRLATYTLFDDAVTVLEMLPRALKLAIVTNGSSFPQREKVESTGLSSRVDAVVVSGEVGAAKPDAAIFRRALALLEVDPQDAIHVGVNLVSDVAGALATGLKAAVWLNRHGAARRPGLPLPTHEISSLLELPDIVKRL
jgi:FMN phosphatase YigB (HAD superfamily)